MDDNIVKNVAFNGLDYVSAFRAAFDVQREADKRFTDRVSLEHMETFFFVMTVADGREVELRHIQKSLDYLQAKMHRTVKTLETLGWVTIHASSEDARQKVLTVTPKGKQFFVIVSKYISPDNNQGDYAEKSAELTAAIEMDAQRRATLAAMSETEQVEEISDEDAQLLYGDGNMHWVVPPDVNDATHMTIMRPHLKGLLLKKGKTKVEVGKNYIKTYEHGIVTFSVLMKRAEVPDLNYLGKRMESMKPEELAELLTPTPRTKIAKLEKEKGSIEQAIKTMMERFDSQALEEQPHLNAQFKHLRQQLALVDAQVTLHTKTEDLKDTAIEFGRWSDAMDEQSERFADAKPGKLARWDDWDKETNPALKRIYGRAIERNELAKSSTTDEDGSET